METKIFLLFLAGSGILLNSCEINDRIIPSGNVTTEAKYFSGYDKLDVSNAFTVFVNFSDTEEIIEIEAEENLHTYITVRKVGDVLYIGLQDHVHIWGNATLNVYITTKQVVDYRVSGASEIIVDDKISAGSVSIDLSGASNFRGDLEVDNANVYASGASGIELEGTANTFDANVSGASSIKDYNLAVNDLYIDLSGASDAFLTINDRIYVNASGASTLYFKGTGVIADQDLSGASEVIRVGN